MLMVTVMFGTGQKVRNVEDGRGEEGRMWQHWQRRGRVLFPITLQAKDWVVGANSPYPR